MSAPTLRLWVVEARCAAEDRWTLLYAQAVYVVASDEADARRVMLAHTDEIIWSASQTVTVEADRVSAHDPVAVTSIGTPRFDGWLYEVPLNDLPDTDERAEWTCAEWLAPVEDLAARTDTRTLPLPLRYADGRTERVERVVSAEVRS